MKIHYPSAVLFMVSTLAISACASHRVSDSQRLATILAHVGEPVNQIRYFNAMGWELVDDEHVLLSMRPRESWLLRVSGPCLQWGGVNNEIAIASRGPVVMARLDRILVKGSPISCLIEEIRPVDTKAMRASGAAARAQQASGG